MKRYLLLTCLLTSVAMPNNNSWAEEEYPRPVRKPLQARVELGARPGTERTIGLTEFWVPIAQNSIDGSVLYADLRMMGDDQDNREFNIGAGYRQKIETAILGAGIAGVHIWYDRRLTKSGSAFNQVTGGMEWFSDIWDAKINAYIPLNNDKSFSRPNPNGPGGGFFGNQIVVNTDQTVLEEALVGVDLELGIKVPFTERFTDSTRIYGGVYHFEGDRADDVTGWRTRITSDITPDLQLGARFQKDDVRGSQGFLEATIRFPFGNKQSYKSEGLYARLDESPERDIDIVSNEAVTDEGTNVPINNVATGTAQRIIHVDNTAAPGGNGSNEMRFNTLAAAQAAAQAHDLIYVHRGNGTSTGQNAGITLNKTGQMLIGAGADLTFDSERFGTSNGLNASSTTIIPAGLAPVITNTGGFGVHATADNIYVSGLSITGTSSTALRFMNSQNSLAENMNISGSGSSGVFMLYSDNRTHSLVLRNIAVSNNAANGAFQINLSNATVLNAGIYDVSAQNFAGNGFRALSAQNSRLNTTLENSVIRNGTSTAVDIIAQNNARINPRIENNEIYNAANIAVAVTVANSSQSEQTIIKNNYMDGVSPFHSILTRVSNDGVIGNLTIENNTAINAGSAAIFIDDCCTTGGTSRIDNTIIRNNIVRNATGIGIFVQKNRTAGNFTNVVIDNNTIQNNGTIGLQINASGNQGGITASIHNNTVSGNSGNGIVINDDTTSPFLVDMGGGTLGSIGRNSVFGNTGSDITVDVDGANLKAENNWWGNILGLLPGRRILQDASNIDSVDFLTAAP
jgi:trimeric autotransporter adhesin